MKRITTIGMAIAIVLVLGAAGAASGQSLGDYARAARKNKPQTDTSRHYDNDNLPTNETLSVVGPDPSAPAKAGQEATATPAADAKTAEHKAADDLQKKIDEQQEKIDTLARELDIAQREYRLRASAYYSDIGNRLRNVAQWEKDDTQFRNDIDSKQKAIESAKQQLGDLQEQARKAGLRQKESDSDKDKDKEKQ